MSNATLQTTYIPSHAIEVKPSNLITSSNNADNLRPNVDSPFIVPPNTGKVVFNLTLFADVLTSIKILTDYQNLPVTVTVISSPSEDIYDALLKNVSCSSLH